MNATMMPLHLSLSNLGMSLTIVDDNARIPSEDLLEQSSPYRRKRKSAGIPSASPKPVQAKPSRWDAIPVSKKLPNSIPRSAMSLNDCARMAMRMPARWHDDTTLDKLQQPLRRPTRSTSYADAATILELALAEVDFPEDDLTGGFSDSFAASI